MIHTQLRGSGRFRLHRGPRKHPAPVPSGEIAVAAPPRSLPPGTSGWPLLLPLLPLLSGVGSLPLLLSSPAPGRRWLLPAMAASLLLSAAAGLGLRLLGRRSAKRAKRAERARYLAHLHGVGLQAARVAGLQLAAAEHLHPDLERLVDLVDGDRVWERSPADADFLQVRVGRGPAALATPLRLDLGRDPLADHDPELLAAARDLVGRAARLDGVPVAVPLRDVGVVTIRGRPARARSLVRGILLRSAVLHAPQDLRVLAVFRPDAAPAWDWLKWLPHARAASVDRLQTAVPPCMLASTAARAADLLEREVRPRLGVAGPPGGAAGGAPGSPRPGGPHLLVVIEGYSPGGGLGRLPVLDELLRAAPELGATVIWLADRAGAEPAATRWRIEVDDRGGLAVREAGPDGRATVGVQADSAGLALSAALARRLAPLWLDGPDARAVPDAEPSPPQLLDALGVPDPAAVDLASAWRQRPAAETLRVPIGFPVTPLAGGAPGESGHRAAPGESGHRAAPAVVLDLKEAAEGGMGPHGLLIGATGSGKSELLRTIVAGLALTHPPELLSLALVDFKGGAAFAPLADLPHTAGLITNLQDDPDLVDRARTALLGELERRQRLLRDANLDSIAQHRRLAVAERVEPLATLLVVVDEFGELLAAHPGFLDPLTAIGRTGRSLGMHLLLASQRLEESRLRGLDGHLRYRICLRTFSPAESTAVLGTPDAFHLPPSPGHGLLRVDGGPCQQFKGLVVAPPPGGDSTGRGAAPPALPLVLPFDPIGAAPDDGLWPVPRVPSAVDPEGLERPSDRGDRGDGDRRGRHDRRGRGDPELAGSGMATLASAAGAAAGRRAHRIWLPPLASVIGLDQVIRPRRSPGAPDRPGELGPPASPEPPCRPGDPDWLRVPVGLVDKPFSQSQEPLLLDFTGRLGHLAIAGAPRGGKSTLLATLVAAFALTHRPDDVQFYCIDLGGGGLHRLSSLPHVGAVAGVHEPGEARRLITELRAVVAGREQAFRSWGIGSMADWHARRREEPTLDQDGYGEVFLLVDNWARLRQELPDLDTEIESLAGVGLHHGVHLVVAANRWADLRLGLRDNLGGRLELRLNDPIESEVGRAAAARLPRRTPGRGLTSGGHQFQVALPDLTAPVADPDHDLAAKVQTTATEPAGAVRGIARRAVRSPAGAVAPRLRRLPALVSMDDLLRRHGAATTELAMGGVPFALCDHRLEVVTLDLPSAPHFLVLGDPECGKTATLRCLSHGLVGRHHPDELRLVVVDYRRTLVELSSAPHCEAYADTPGPASDAIRRVRSLLDQRLRSNAEPVDADAAASAAGRRLGEPSWRPGGCWRGWSGPRYVLVVDDYDLVASAAGNPLEPLVDLVARGRDIGLHVLLARPVSGTGRSSFEPFYQRIREGGSPGLIMSGDPREGELLAGRAAAPQPPGRGHLVRRHGRNGLVQVAWAAATTGGWLATAPADPDAVPEPARSAWSPAPP